jgi:hypothetical protein
MGFINPFLDSSPRAPFDHPIRRSIKNPCIVVIMFISGICQAPNPLANESLPYFLFRGASAFLLQPRAMTYYLGVLDNEEIKAWRVIDASWECQGFDHEKSKIK